MAAGQPDIVSLRDITFQLVSLIDIPAGQPDIFQLVRSELLYNVKFRGAQFCVLLLLRTNRKIYAHKILATGVLTFTHTSGASGLKSHRGASGDETEAISSSASAASAEGCICKSMHGAGGGGGVMSVCNYSLHTVVSYDAMQGLSSIVFEDEPSVTLVSRESTLRQYALYSADILVAFYR